MNETILDSAQLSQICFTLFRTMHLNMFKNISGSEKLDYFDSMVSGEHKQSKHFTMREEPNKQIGLQVSKSMIDWFVASENTTTQSQSRRNRWLNGIYDEVNNCSNLNQSMEPTTSIDSDNKEQENVESKLPGLGLKKTSLTMAHMFELCLKKEEHGTCRNCSTDVNSFTLDELQLKFLDSTQEIIPNCSTKLTSKESFHGFTLLIKCNVSSKTFRLQKIQISDKSFRFSFLNALNKLDFNNRITRQISDNIEMINERLINCALAVDFIIEETNPMTGAVKEAITQGYYPLPKGIEYSKWNMSEKSPLLDKVRLLVEIVSRSCNPMLFLSPEEFLRNDRKLIERISAIEFDNEVDKWPPTMLTVTPNVRKLMNEGLRYGVESNSLRNLLFKEVNRDTDGDRILFNIDTTRFWM